MPRALCDVWRHYTAANVEGKAVHICKYCAKSYVKNATKMQNRLAKCIKFPQRSQQATSDKSPFTSIRGENYESDTLSIATAHGPPGIRRFFDSWEECSQRKMLMNVLLKLCIQLVHLDAHRQYVLEEFSECPLTSIHPSNQTCFIYSFAGCRVKQSSSEGQAYHRESRRCCNHL
jgi:hypothetical protein